MNEDQIECSQCHVIRRTKQGKNGPKLPPGWKRRHADLTIFCAACWRTHYILRAITFPVAQPLTGSWKELEAALKPMWILAAEASNWIMTTCYTRDVRRTEEQAKMPAMPSLYLYPELRALFPQLPTQSVTSLDHAIQRKYRAQRYEIVWTRACSLPSLRYPQPFSLHNGAWSTEWDTESRPVLDARIADRRWKLRLKSGPRYRRQVAQLQRMEERGELALLKSHDGMILCKLVGWLSRPPATQKAEGVVVVRTGPDHLLSAFDVRETRQWIENGDHLPRLAAAHRRQLQRLAEDQKAEQRPTASFQARREELARKYHARMKSAVDETAMHLANFCVRRRISVVRYSDQDRWLEQFPYFSLEKKIQQDLDKKGIAFERIASEEAAAEAASSLAEV